MFRAQHHSVISDYISNDEDSDDDGHALFAAIDPLARRQAHRLTGGGLWHRTIVATTLAHTQLLPSPKKVLSFNESSYPCLGISGSGGVVVVGGIEEINVIFTIFARAAAATKTKTTMASTSRCGAYINK